jgi:nucleoid-associated protein YgaU
MDILGKLEKLKLLAFKDNAFTKPAIPPAFPVLINPESYALNYTVEYNTDAAQGNNGTTARYTRHSPEEFSCDLWFDNTGILDGIPRPDVYLETEAFKKFLLDIESETHEPRHFMVIWGKMIFKGRVTGLQMEYKLFKPDGTPIRAMAKVTFKGSFDDVLRLALANLFSPDLTHRRQVKAGDTLANLCYEMYGSPRYTPQIAKVNRLANYRHLVPGTELFFPPFDKKEPAK